MFQKLEDNSSVTTSGGVIGQEGSILRICCEWIDGVLGSLNKWHHHSVQRVPRSHCDDSSFCGSETHYRMRYQNRSWEMRTSSGPVLPVG